MENAYLFVDNSIAERSIKPFVIGRKNWPFSGNENGAESSCSILLLLKMQNITISIHTNTCDVFLNRL